jgi:hypothetical protein
MNFRISTKGAAGNIRDTGYVLAISTTYNTIGFLHLYLKILKIGDSSHVRENFECRRCQSPLALWLRCVAVNCVHITRLSHNSKTCRNQAL